MVHGHAAILAISRNAPQAFLYFAQSAIAFYAKPLAGGQSSNGHVPCC
jgi:hypothetical protein